MAKPRTKADEVALKAARSADKVALKSSLLEELRFAKRQQMAVATSAMALLGAILAIGNLLKPLSGWEKWVGMGGAMVVALVGSGFIWSLENHLKRTRLRIDPDDPRYLKRTRLRIYPLGRRLCAMWVSLRRRLWAMWVLIIMLSMLFVTAGIVCYVLVMRLAAREPPPQIPFSLDDMLY
jgi:hypothetical protein